jgi:uncharacterized protein (TIGR00661 family)
VRILYGVQSTGNGHITRSSKIVQRLSKSGCMVDVIFSGNNSQVNFPLPIKYNFNGLTFYYDGKGSVDYWKTFNELKLFKFFKDIKLDLSKYDLIISDFEPISAWAAKLQDKPSIGIANQYSFLSKNTPRPDNKDLLSEMILKWMAPVDKPIGLHFEKYDDFIKPPILRSSLYNFESKNKGHYTVYLSNWDESNLHQILKKINYKFEVFCNIKKPHRLNNCFFKPIEKTSFDESLKTSQGIITAAGFQTCSEALYLNKDLIAIPINNQYEQLCNVESLKRINVKVGKIEQIECMINMGFTQRPGYWQDPTDEIINEILNFRFK